MSLTRLGEVKVLVWNQNDLRYPIGRWIGYGWSQGDTSGGYNAIVLNFPTGQKYLWSVEGITFRENALNGVSGFRRVQVSLIGAEGVIGGISFVWDRQYKLEDGTISDAGAPLQPWGHEVANLNAPWPLAPGNAPGQVMGIRAVTSNRNTVFFEFGAWGWIWDARVLTIRGGPRKLGDTG